MIFYLFLKINFDINILKQFENMKKIIWSKKKQIFSKTIFNFQPLFYMFVFLVPKGVARTKTAVHRRILWCGAFDVRKIRYLPQGYSLCTRGTG